MRSLSLVALLVLAACASSGTQVKDSALTQFQKGVTTDTDVVKALGPPTATTTNSDGTRVISYVGTQARAKASSFIPIVGLFKGGATGQTNVVTFRFGPDHKLIDYSSTQSNVDVNTGITGASPDVKQ